MNQNQKKMLFCLFQTAVTVSGIYFYMFSTEIYNDVEIGYIIGSLLSSTCVYIWVYFGIIGVSNCIDVIYSYKNSDLDNINEYVIIVTKNTTLLYSLIWYYVIQIIKGFMISFCIIGLVDERTFSFQDLYSYHFIGAFYIQTLLYVCFSKDLLQRRSLVPNEQIFETEGVFRCAYEVIYYILSLLIIITYFMKFQVDQLQQPQNLIGTLIINTTVYMLYSITKIGILVKMFLIITTTRLLYFCIKSIGDENQQTVVIIITILTAIFMLRIIQQSVKGIVLARKKYYESQNNVPVDILAALNLLPQREPYNYGRVNVHPLSEHDLLQLQSIPFEPQSQLEALCAICDMGSYLLTSIPYRMPETLAKSEEQLPYVQEISFLKR
ncbi:hypothetical protein pb186bvf_002330 [Paramecium bursaria]